MFSRYNTIVIDNNNCIHYYTDYIDATRIACKYNFVMFTSASWESDGISPML